MIKKLTKHGNSTAIILDKSLLKILNINSETELKIKTDGESIIITPVNAKPAKELVSDNDAVQKAVEKIMKQYAPALKMLSKN